VTRDGSLSLLYSLNHAPPDTKEKCYLPNRKIRPFSKFYYQFTSVIALAGNTGNSRDPYLHLEVQKNGVPLDPLTLLEQERYYG